MSIYRGTGGSSTTTDETTINAVNQKAAEAATSASNAASSASSASTSASNSATSASQAATSATNAATSASQALQSKNTAGTSATAAQAAQVAAEAAQVEAESAKDTAVTYGSNAVSANTTAQAAKTAAETARDVTKGYRDEVLAADSTAAASASDAADSATAAGLSATAAAASASAAATTASESEVALQALVDSVKSFYLGAEASAPTVDDNGDPLEAGDWYFNTTDNLTYVYNGSSWQVTVTDLTGVLVSSNNLSELTNTTAARTNLGLGTAATTAATDYVAKAGDSMTGNLSFGDNDKAIFGAGSDLQIYHDGSNSVIHDAGTGNLNIRANDLWLANDGFTQGYLHGVAGGTTEMFYSGSKKLATTSTGIDVTGTATMDGLTVDGLVTATDRFQTGSGVRLGGAYTAGVLGYTDANWGSLTRPPVAGEQAAFGFQSYAGTDLMRITEGGDIFFYEDTGTTAKFFWDASAESLGIGTSSPAGNLHVYGGAGTTPVVRVSDGSGYSLDSGVLGAGLVGLETFGGATSIGFKTNSAERMRIDSSGNVGIGTSNPVAFGTLAVSGTGSVINANASSGAAKFSFFENGTGRFEIETLNGSNGAKFSTSGSERMRIDSSGNFHVAKSGWTGINGNGFSAMNAGWVQASTDSTTTALFNRNATDGNIVGFYKDGTTVGSIGSAAGSRLFVGNGDVGLRFADDLDQIAPWNTSTSAIRDGVIDLGESVNRFKDLYLSGGVYLGGTGSANHLDDYEEGTFTPILRQSTTNPSSVVYTAQVGKYVKVGNIVVVFVDISWSSLTAGSGSAFVNLPFAAGSAFNMGTSRSYKGVTLPANNFITNYVSPTSSGWNVQRIDITSGVETNITSWNSSGRYNAQVTYTII